MLYLFIGALLIITAKSQSCTTSADCTLSESAAVCATDNATPTCVACLTDSDCTDSTWYTNLGYDTCTVTEGVGLCSINLGCETDADCSGDLICENNICVTDCNCGTCATGQGCLCWGACCSCIESECTTATVDDDCDTDDGESCLTVNEIMICGAGCTSEDDCGGGDFCGVVEGLSGSGVCVGNSTDTSPYDGVSQLTTFIGMIIMISSALFM